MVLHNDKWDKKNKKAYMRKHGIQPAKPETAEPKQPKRHFVQKEFDKHNQDSSEEGSDDEEFPVLQQAAAGPGRKLQGYVGKLEELPSEAVETQTSDDVDNEEQEEAPLPQWMVRDLPPVEQTDEDDELLAQIYSKTTKSQSQAVKGGKRNLDKLSPADLLKLKIGSTGVTRDTKDSQVKILSNEEAEKFKEMQVQTSRAKDYQELKFKFSSEAQDFKKRQQAGKVLDLTKGEAYQNRVQSKILQAQNQTKKKITDEEFEDDLRGLLGGDYPQDDDKTQSGGPAANDVIGGDDLDELLKTDASTLKMPKKSENTTASVPVSSSQHTALQEDEDFLEELLSLK